MRRSFEYPWTKFSEQVLRRALSLAFGEGTEAWTRTLEVEAASGDRWSLDTLDQFFAEYARDVQTAEMDCAWLSLTPDHVGLTLRFERHAECVSTVTVVANSRARIMSVFDVFDSAAESCQVERSERRAALPARVFIGHGRSQDWRDLADHLRDLHGFEVEAFESRPRAGMLTKEVLESMIARSSMALLVHSPEDETSEGRLRPRENVVHETGLFQGRLGFDRAIILRKEGCDSFSNIAGVTEIRYVLNIQETFGEVVATLHRELPDHRPTYR